MKIKMTKSQNVSPNGIKVERWMKGTVHEADEKLGNTLVKALKAATIVMNPIVKSEEKKKPEKPKPSKIRIPENIKQHGNENKNVGNTIIQNPPPPPPPRHPKGKNRGK